MEGIIQNACIQIVRQMNKKKQYSDSEKEVFAYGLEIILDSLLKAVIYLAVGFAFGRGREVAVVMLFFGVLRKTSGGKHAKTSIMCFILTGGILAFSVSFPLMCRMSGTGYGWICTWRILEDGCPVCCRSAGTYFGRVEKELIR